MGGEQWYYASLVSLGSLGVFWGFFLITVFIIVNSITSITSIVIMFYFVSIIKLFLTHELWWGVFLEGRDWLLGWFSFLFNFFFFLVLLPIPSLVLWGGSERAAA